MRVSPRFVSEAPCVVRLADHQIDFGVVSEAVSDGDEWPLIRERILAAEILLMAIPTWLGQPSSVAKIALERMDAFLSETREDGKTPIAYNRVAGVVVVGNEDGAHHVIGGRVLCEDESTCTIYGMPRAVAEAGLAHQVLPLAELPAETNAAPYDIGFSVPGQNWTYWNKGPGPGEEEWLTTDERDRTISTGKACASNLLAMARALAASPIPPPAGA